MLALLKEVRKKAVIGFVGGSDLIKQHEQLGSTSGFRDLCSLGSPGSYLRESLPQFAASHQNFSLLNYPTVLEDFDFCFAENGLTAYRKGVQLPSEVRLHRRQKQGRQIADPHFHLLFKKSFINWMGEEKYKTLVNFCLHYIADLDLPKKRWASYFCCSRFAGRNQPVAFYRLSQGHFYRVP